MLETLFFKKNPFAERKKEPEVTKQIIKKLAPYCLRDRDRADFPLVDNYLMVVLTFGRLVIELEEQMDKYDCIISDEISGRTVALILRNVINHQKRKKQMQLIPSYFIKGGRYLDEATYQAIKNYLINKKSQFGSRALLVTEYVDSGESIVKLGAILNTAGIKFDIAALSISQNFAKKPGNTKAANIYYGEVNQVGLGLFDGKLNLGVCKTDSDNNPYPSKSPFYNINKVKKWRREIKNLSQALINLVE